MMTIHSRIPPSTATPANSTIGTPFVTPISTGFMGATGQPGSLPISVQDGKKKKKPGRPHNTSTSSSNTGTILTQAVPQQQQSSQFTISPISGDFYLTSLT
jgi:hypothetical protein